jgi:predicted ATPase
MERGGAESPLTVPDTIQGVLMARIDRLADAPKRTLQTASVLGREFSARHYLARALEIFERLGTLIEPDRIRAELAALPA